MDVRMYVYGERMCAYVRRHYKDKHVMNFALHHFFGKIFETEKNVYFAEFTGNTHA